MRRCAAKVQLPSECRISHSSQSTYFDAVALGRGGISVVAAATELSHPTIRRGIAELQAGDDSPPGETQPDHPRIRRPGGGRYSIAATDRTLLRDLKRLIDPATRGDPMSPLLWTCKSTRNLANALAELGHDLSHQTVSRLLVDLGYSLQANRKTEEGKDHPDRDAQFEHINRRVRSLQRRGQPVVSVDTKKTAMGGNWSDWVSKAMYGRSLSRRTGGLFICTYGSRWPSGATSVDSRTTSRHSEISGERPHTAVSDVCGPTERHASLRLCASEEITTLFGPFGRTAR